MFKLPIQKRIDNGELGGAWTIFNQSLSILGLLNFVQLTMIAYIMVFKPYISLLVFVFLYVFSFSAWIIIYYVYLLPSIIVFSNRQSFTPERNPLNREIQEIRKDLEEIKRRL